MTDFKLTYATTFAPPEEMHQKKDAALQKIKESPGSEYAIFLLTGREHKEASRKVVSEEQARNENIWCSLHINNSIQGGCFSKQPRNESIPAHKRPFVHLKVEVIQDAQVCKGSGKTKG